GEDEQHAVHLRLFEPRAACREDLIRARHPERERRSALWHDLAAELVNRGVLDVCADAEALLAHARVRERTLKASRVAKNRTRGPDAVRMARSPRATVRIALRRKALVNELDRLFCHHLRDDAHHLRRRLLRLRDELLQLPRVAGDRHDYQPRKGCERTMGAPPLSVCSCESMIPLGRDLPSPTRRNRAIASSYALTTT